MSAFGRWFAPASGPSETSTQAPPAAPSGPSTTTSNDEQRRASSSDTAPPPAAALLASAASATAAAKPGGGDAGRPDAVEVGHSYDSPEPDLYRTFSPSEVAFWDLKAPADGQSGSGFFARFFGSGGGGGGGGAAAGGSK